MSEEHRKQAITNINKKMKSMGQMWDSTFQKTEGEKQEDLKESEDKLGATQAEKGSSFAFDISPQSYFGGDNSCTKKVKECYQKVNPFSVIE